MCAAELRIRFQDDSVHSLQYAMALVVWHATFNVSVLFAWSETRTLSPEHGNTSCLYTWRFSTFFVRCPATAYVGRRHIFIFAAESVFFFEERRKLSFKASRIVRQLNCRCRFLLPNLGKRMGEDSEGFSYLATSIERKRERAREGEREMKGEKEHPSDLFSSVVSFLSFLQQPFTSAETIVFHESNVRASVGLPWRTERTFSKTFRAHVSDWREFLLKSSGMPEGLPGEVSGRTLTDDEFSRTLNSGDGYT